MFRGIEDLRSNPASDDPQFVVLGPDDRTYYYTWGDDESGMPWAQLIGMMHEAARAGGIQASPNDISFDHGRILIDATPSEYKWGRYRTKYSFDVKTIVRELLRRALVDERTRIKLGNWANRKGYVIGTAAEVAGRRDVPARLVLYHGTTDYHYEQIKTGGLCPVRLEQRIWKDVGSRRGHPGHREFTVYLTASPEQAGYYAGKAVRNMRARGWRGLTPVVLKVLLLPRDYVNLRADDDYLSEQHYLKKEPREDDWLDSLQYFAQVAFVGCVPPDRIVAL